MVKLVIPRKDESNLVLVDQLTELALSHQIGVNPNLKTAVLTDGNTRTEGSKDIKAYLAEMKQELQQWWYCSC